MKRELFKTVLLLILLFPGLAGCEMPGNESSAENSAEEAGDKTPPEAPSVSGVLKTNNQKPRWTWDVPADTVKFRIQMDSEEHEWLEVESSITDYTPAVNLSEGIHTLYVQAADAANNWSVSGSFASEIDLTAPSAPYVTGTASPSNNARPTWNWTIPWGAVNYRYRLDGGSWVVTGGIGTISFSPLSPLSEGEHTLEVQALDNVNNWSASGSYTITLDLTPPEAPVVTGISLTSDTTPTWNWTVPAGCAVISYRMYKVDSVNYNWTHIEGADLTLITSYTPVSALGEGEYIFEMHGRDTVGNWSEYATFSTTIDLTAPEAPDVTGINRTNDTTPTWSWTVPAGAVGFRYRLNSGSWIVLQGTDTTSYTPESALPERSSGHTLEVQALDSVGHWSGSGSFTIIIDITGPEKPEVSADILTNDTTPTWNWTFTSGTAVFRYRLDGGSWVTHENLFDRQFTPASELSEGAHTLEVQACDSVGNWSQSGSHTVTIDITGPEKPEVSGDVLTNSSTPTWNWTIPDGSAAIRYRLDEGNWKYLYYLNSGADSYTADSELSEGEHTLEVQARDSLQNWSQTGSFTTTIDLTPPEAPVVSAVSNSPTFDTTPAWSWTIPADAVNIRYRIDGGTWVETGTTSIVSYTSPAALTRGEHTLEVEARDSAGNWSNPGNRTIMIALEAPEGLTASDNETGTISISWNAVPDGYEYLIYRSTVSGSGYTEIYNTRGLAFTDFNALPGITYYYQIKAKSSNDIISDFSTYAEGLCLLSTPANVIASDGDVNRIRISWFQVNGAESYHIYRSTSPDSGYSEVGTSSSTIFYDTRPLGTHYYYQVRAYSAAAGYSDYSDYDRGHVGIAAPGSVTATDGTYSDKITISWNSVPDAALYYVYMSGTSGNSYRTKVAETTDTTFDYTAGLLGKEYFFSVKAVHSSLAESKYSPEDRGSKDFPAPANLSVSKGTYSDRIEITCDEIIDCTWHEISRSTSPAGPYTVLINTNALFGVVTFSDYDITPGKVYYYRVRGETGGPVNYYYGEYSTIDSGFTAQ